MSSSSASRLLDADAIDDLRRLREVFAAAEYSDGKLIERVGPSRVPARRSTSLPRMLRLTASGDRLDGLIRLFLLGVPLDEPAARHALAPLDLDAVAALGLITRTDGGIAATVTAFPYGSMVLVFDQPEQITAGAREDLVVGITDATRQLIRFTVRRPSRRTLDLGTGCGIQAFLAAPHSREVYASDLNPRAVNFARFNARLNGIDNVRCLEGSGFEPVREHSFDLVLANLPFVIVPRFRYYYRDSGIPLDGFARQVARESAQHLSEGGYCQMLCEWVHIKGEDARERLRGWFEGTGCDAWIARLESYRPVEYAEQWIRDTETGDPELARRLYQEWTDFYDREGIEEISAGLVALRRRATGGDNWFWLDDGPEELPDAYGAVVDRAFATRDFLEQRPADSMLLDQVLHAAPDLRLLRESQWTPEGWQPVSARLIHTSGMPYAGNIDAPIARLLALSDGTRRLREVLEGLAAELGVAPERVLPAALPVVRRLLDRGFLIPAGLE
jgi:methylase of polypeptide subunit release factors